MTAVLGRSGSGKTTTLLSVLGQHPYTGHIELDGRDISRMKPRKLYRQVGIVFQNPANQFVTQNVEDEVRVGLELWEPGLSDAQYRQRADELLEAFGLYHTGLQLSTRLLAAACVGGLIAGMMMLQY